jgi:hypothetical protein
MKIKDKQKFVFNPLTGNFDLVLKFNEDQIVTSDYNAAGSPFLTYDLLSDSYINDYDQPVVDEEGNLVIANDQENVILTEDGNWIEA